MGAGSQPLPTSLTLGETLELPTVKGGLPQVLVGADRLTREVRWAHVIDLPDPRRLLRGGELVLTTGYGMPETVAGRREWVERVAEQEAAALAVEIGVVFTTELPPGIVAACEARGLPLIVFRRRVAFVELTRAINSTIADRGGVIAAFVSSVQSELIDMLGRDRSLGDMLDMVANQLRVPLVLEGAGRDVIHCAFGGIAEGEVFRALADLHRYERNGMGDIALAANLARGEGRVIALEVETSLGPQHRALLTATAQVLSLFLLRGGASDLNATSNMQFLEDLAAERMPSRVAAERATLQGFTPTRPMIAVVARYRAARRSRDRSPWTDLAGPLRNHIESLGFRCLVGASSEELIGLVETNAEKPDSIAELAFAFREMCAAQRADPHDVALVLSREGRGWRDAGTQLADGIRRARVAEVLVWRPWFDTGEPELGDLLYEIRDSPALHRFVKARLGPLTESGSRGTVALETLAALVANGGNKAGTAKALHLDRSALYQRIKRIEADLACDLSDPRTLLSLHLALEAEALLKRYPTA